MKKITTLFQRNHEGNHRVRNELSPGAEWVVEGQGIPTRKWDGIAVKIEGGEVFRRLDAKAGRTPPKDFIPLQPQPDPKTGHWPGWIPAVLPAAVYILEAVKAAAVRYPSGIPDGTYEVCGPEIGTRHGANPEQLTEHVLIPHGEEELHDCPRDYDGLMEYLRDKPIEGVVWHHPDGRMIKIKKADFPY